MTTSSVRARTAERVRERQDERKADLRERLEEARGRTFRLLAPVSDDDLMKQHSPIMSPLAWDLAHIGNFEELWLVQTLGKAPPMDPIFDEMYDAFKNPRRERVQLSLLNRHQSERYLAVVRAAAFENVERANLHDVDPLTRDGYVFEMIIQHEYQHNETMLATLKLMAAPGYRPELPPSRTGAPAEQEMVFVEEGAYLMGTDDRSMAYDNERPSHEVYLPSYWIDTTPVTNGAYLHFVKSGGYTNPEWWSRAGQRWLAESGASAPQFWDSRDGNWWVNTYGHWLPLNPLQPVQHVCYFEAEAYARWIGKRLPTEAEWEKAASWDPIRRTKRTYPWGDEPPTREHANLDQLNFQPMEVGAFPRGVSAYGCHQMIGDVWEWVASDFRGYPGFQAWPYNEYSEVFFGPDYMMLRGGSWAVRPGVIRNTFRNWDFPIRRQIFSGFRCARDAE